MQKRGFLKKPKQFRAIVSTDGHGKSYMDFLKNPFLDSYDYLERQETTPRAHSVPPLKYSLSPVKLLLIYAARNWRHLFVSELSTTTVRESV